MLTSDPRLWYSVWNYGATRYLFRRALVKLILMRRMRREQV